MNLQLEGKLALVTGGSKGIGAAIARKLAEEGCETVIVGRNSDQLEAIAASIAADTGSRCHAEAADLSRSEAITDVAAKWAHVDILVNNAGAIPGGRLGDISEAAWREAWDLKVFGYINLTRALFDAMAKRGQGVVVNIIGAAAQIRDPSYICGVTGNAALTAFTMSLGSDSHRHGVRVVGVSPGPVATERLQQLLGAVESSAARPFGRAASPEEIAAAAVFLASPISGYTTGTVLMVDGGISARAAS
ncbi:short-chain dehydrogenase/reductase [Sphingopyxis sp.]|uniref:short-chain dehydrogenase/reductase n=1 Tax=Sphingopyxis sp. TaxID=1908224 RepID=UPI002B4857FF|nr:short-chain dehydrogenase/reductase [Sphingopyxis sp.]HJS09765.1 short-chain dehydrogenase/reductase [Sphingopyxis sp.]